MRTDVVPENPPTHAEAVGEIVVSFIRDELGEAEVTGFTIDDNLLTSGLVDSVGILRLIGHLERRLGVKVPPEELVPDNFRTIRTMGEFMLGLRQDRAQHP